MPAILAIALDVDGVLTDGTFWWNSDGTESKRFSFRDVMGISLARRAGLVLALVSGEDTAQVHRFAAKMGISAVYAGCKDKAGALRDFSDLLGIPLEAIAFMGDDINDLTAMALAGLAAAPADAHESARNAASFISRSPGGKGAVRELVDSILAGRLVTSSGASTNQEPSVE